MAEEVQPTHFSIGAASVAFPPVTRLYFAHFLRIPDYGGLNFWIGQARAGSSLDAISQQLDSGACTRGQMMTGFSESVEYRAAIASEIW